MPQYKKTFNTARNLVILTIATSLVACSTGTEDTNSPAPSASSSPVAASSPQTAISSASAALLGVNSSEEIKFNPASKNSTGFFDSLGGATTTTATVDLKAGTPVNVYGWAILTDKGTPADKVLITYGDNNSLVAVAPVILKRPDVGRALKNPAYNTSGWVTNFNASSLPAGKLVLKAWAYNAASKEASPLNKSFEVNVVK